MLNTVIAMLFSLLLAPSPDAAPKLFESRYLHAARVIALRLRKGSWSAAAFHRLPASPESGGKPPLSMSGLAPLRRDFC